MKRMTAWLLAFCLIAASILPVRAAGISGADLPKGDGAEVENDTMPKTNGIQMGTEAVPEVNGTQPGTGTPAGTNGTQPGTGTPAGTNGTQPGTGTPAGTNGTQPGTGTSAGTNGVQTESGTAEEGGEQGNGLGADGLPLTVSGNTLFSLKNAAWNNEYAPSDAKGSVEVIMRNVLPISETSNISLNVTLEDKNSQTVIGRGQVALEREPVPHMLSFDALPAGTYCLKVTEDGSAGANFGFLAYEQEITVKGDVQTAEIHTGFVDLEGVDYKAGFHPGVLLIGDANRDGKIDAADKEALMEAMSRGENGVLRGDPNVELTDLDKDGKTDLIDLQYYVNSKAKLDESVQNSAVLATRIAPDAVKVNINQSNTVVEGEVDNLLTGETGLVKLKSRDGGAITEDRPVEIGFNLQTQEMAQTNEYAKAESIAISMGENSIESGVVLIETDTGTITEEIVNGEQALEGRMMMAQSLDIDNMRNTDNVLKIDLRGQIAVKKVIIRITGTKRGGSLAEISKVEFLNDMEKRISEPNFNIPEILTLTGGDQSFHLAWKVQPNVTGYEVEVGYNGLTEVIRVSSDNVEVKSFQNDKLTNGVSYSVRVCSVNGTWTGKYSDWRTVMPEASSRPDAPDGLKAVGGYCCIRLSWKNMKNTDSYNVYYKEAGESVFRKITDIKENKYEITGLKDQTKYEVYVTGVNALGESNPSIHSEATTITLKPAQMPNYKLINESNGTGKVSAHIVSATHGRGAMVTSPLDADSNSALGTVDKDYGSYYQILDWDDGAVYVAPNKGILYTLDDYYEMSYITFAEPEDIASYAKVSVYYYDEQNPNGKYAENVSVMQRTDPNGRKFYLIKLAEPVKANKIKLGFSRGYNLYNMTIAEVNFYYYDSLEDDILALFADDLHTTLKPEVTEAVIDALQKRLDTIDPKSGEYHPERDMLQKELDNARILLTTGFNDVVEIYSTITAAKDKHLGFSGLNAWQPLGVTAYEGEQIIVYVGHNQLKTGSNSALKLIATQYHAESGALASEVATLKVGRNEITVPSIQSLACEGGGALYIQYTGNNSNDRYAVRVSGGAKEPVLNLYGITDEGQRKERILSYVKELEEHVASQEEMHRQIHEAAGGGNKVNREYDKQNCILGATDIMLDQMLMSVSAEQILAGLGGGTTQERADKLAGSLQAMDEMMELFYHHKGLTRDESAPATDRMPVQHLNIRYMRMFAGAFMYAAGNHIGIERGSVSGLSSSVPVQTDGNGKYVSGRYFGWGIGHEIGHNINQGSYAIAEVTNNYFAQLIKSEDSNSTVRFRYEDVYKKVTSNTVGKPSNVFVHLAMYWQLHLAYDKGYNYKMYDSYEQQQANLFYARVDSYSRDASLAKGGLRLDGGSDQNIMRLACAAAEKDLTEFFVRWGLVPDEETIRYASQFDKEERALYYLTDDARVYEIEHGVSGSVKGQNVIGAGSSVSIGGTPNEVRISIQSTANPDVILGYEIARYSYEDGMPVRQVVGFSTDTDYSDVVSLINNRVLSYEVIAVDKFGYRSNAQNVGTVRISHDGSHDKSLWTVTTNMVSAEDSADTAEDEDPCVPETVSAIHQVIDGDYAKDYSGSTVSSDAVVMIRMNQVLDVCGLKYTVKSGTPIGSYAVEVSMDGNNWTTVKTGNFENKTGSHTIYFENEAEDPWIRTYDAAYVRLKALGQSTANIAEIDLLGPTGDSISFGAEADSTKGAVGILQENYTYSQGKFIPKGSLIFTGSYKGNPDYNVVVIYDEEGNIVGDVDEEGALNAQQIILAKVPENGMRGEVSDGIWIYWIDPDIMPDLKGKTVRAQLYRVDNALTNEGERLVSDTMPLRIPETLENIILNAGTADNKTTQ